MKELGHLEVKPEIHQEPMKEHIETAFLAPVVH